MDSVEQLIRLDWDLATLHRQCMAKLMSEHNIYPGQPPMLFTLKRLGACNQNELARAMRASPATVAVSLRRLEKSGYVRRAQNPHDLRSNRIELTQAGVGAAEWADGAIRMVNSRKVSGFTDQEVEAIAALYHKMRQNLLQLLGELDAGSPNSTDCKE